MRDRALRLVLALLAFGGAVVGVWATFFPRSFYDDFPGGGRAWVSPDGPYNEHLVRDVGSLNLALTVLAIVAAVVLARSLVVVAALGWLTFGVPHLVYHLRHLDPFDTADQIGIVASLALAPVLAVVALLLIRPSTARGGDMMRASTTTSRSSPSTT